MPDIDALVKKLEAWTLAGGFFLDRQLADEVLIADCWSVVPDKTFEGGFRWQWGNLCSSESTRPHPINDMNAALGVVPRRATLKLEIKDGSATAIIWHGYELFQGKSERPSVAVLIAAIKAKRVRECRACGCTEKDCSICIQRAGEPCHWVEQNLCSACVPMGAALGTA